MEKIEKLIKSDPYRFLASSALIFLVMIMVLDFVNWKIKVGKYEEIQSYIWKKVKQMDAKPSSFTEVPLNKIFQAKKIIFVKSGEKYYVFYFTKKDKSYVKVLPSMAKTIEKKLVESNKNFFWLDGGSLRPPKPEIVKFLLVDHPFALFILLQALGIMALPRSKREDLLSQLGLLKRKMFEVLSPHEIDGSMDDLIGYDDLKKELHQLIDVFRRSATYKSYGVQENYNIMFSGPPGTGKTKMAGYFAKELGAPIIIASGNLETGYVGGGASTIRSLFDAATKAAEESPSGMAVLFIDEAQNLLKKRGQYSEKWADDTNNELLAFLDGIRTQKEHRIITILGTNFDDSNMDMDEAMARRFKKKIFFRLPSFNERKEIFDRFLEKIEEKAEVDSSELAKVTSGLSPAMIENIVQEAGLLAAREGGKVTNDVLMKAFEVVIIGQSDRKTTEELEWERKVISVHEMGHFLVRFVEEYAVDQNIEKALERTSLIKISSEAISKIGALGFVLEGMTEENVLTRRDLEKDICSLYGGVAAEKVVFGHVSTSASSDIDRATELLKSMYEELAMHTDAKLNREILGEEVQIQVLEKEAAALYKRAEKIIRLNLPLLHKLKDELLDRWTLSSSEVLEILKKELSS